VKCIPNKVSVNWSTKKTLTLLVIELTFTAAIEDPCRAMPPIGVPESKPGWGCLLVRKSDVLR
jgi:hypothetical protein